MRSFVISPLRGLWREGYGSPAYSNQSFSKDHMKLTLDAKEFAELLRQAIRDSVGFEPVGELEFDLGNDETLPFDLVKGLIVQVSPSK